MKRVLLLGFVLVGVTVHQSHAQQCSNTSVGLTPLNDIGTGFYRGLQGGLYPDGENVRPDAHNAAGVAIANEIRPLDVNGNPDDLQGRIVMLSIGMSNTMQEFEYLQILADSIENKNPNLVLVNGAQGGQDIDQIIDSTDSFWRKIDDTLSALGLSGRQVQVIWFKEAEAYPLIGNDTAFVPYVSSLAARFKIAMSIIRSKYENAQLCYIASRIYGGYATDELNPEPFAYYNGWSVKSIIEAQIDGDTSLTYSEPDPRSPWLSWGVYLWADGLMPRSDNLTWICPDDYLPDGTHPSAIGRTKVASMLLDFFMNDETTQPWFLGTISTEVGGQLANGVPLSYHVTNYPNPFNPATTIRFDIPVAQHVTLTVYDILGQEVERLVDREVSGGVHEVLFNAPKEGSGLYFYRLMAGRNSVSGSMVFIK